MSIELESIASGEIETFNVHESNSKNLQQKLLKGGPTMIKMKAHGKGLAFVEISCEYFKEMTNAGKNYELRVSSERTVDAKTITIHIAVRAMAENIDADVRGMTLLEVELPSGFEYRNEEQIYKQLANSGVKVRLLTILHLNQIFISWFQKVKLTNDRKIAVLYFDPLSSTSILNFNVKGYLVGQVLHLKRASVQVYSYTSRGKKISCLKTSFI